MSYLTGILTLLLMAAPAGASWKAGLGKVVITPREPIMMGGYASRDHPSEGVRQDLHAKALALEDESGRRVVIVTLDLSGIPKDVADPIVAQAASAYGLRRDQLMLNASHTHSGPVAGYRPRNFYHLTPQQAVVVKRYTDQLVGHVVSVIGAALKDLAPANLSFEMGYAGFAVNRRRVGRRNLPQPVDHDVLVLSVRDLSGKLRGIIFGYACHATVLNDYQINGDWPGYAQADLEKTHPGAVALFVAGCGADQNPLPRRSVELAETYGRIISIAVSQVLSDKMKPIDPELKTAFQTVDILFDTPPSREQWRKLAQSSDRAVAAHARLMLDQLDRNGKLRTSYPYPVQLLRMGGVFTLVALGGEVVVDYSLRLRAAYGWDNTWIASYSNDVFAYIPSLRVWKEGGYEAGDSMNYSDFPGRFSPQVEEIVVAKVDDMMRRISK